MAKRGPVSRFSQNAGISCLWLQIPDGYYWRPVWLSVLFFAQRPVLFFDLPRKLLIITAIFPFIAYWLIWGGAIWVPAICIVGLRCGYFVYSTFRDAEALRWLLLAALRQLGRLDCLRIHFPATHSERRCGLCHQRDLGGFMFNMMLGVTACRCPFPSGSLGAGASIEHAFDQMGLRGVHRIHSWRSADHLAVRGKRDAGVFFPTVQIRDLFLRVVIMITMFSSAYIAEVIRGGLAALPKGQYEAADSPWA